MKQKLSSLRMLLSVVVTSVLMLGPAAVPIITPRALVRTIIGCQSQTMGIVTVTDSRGRTYALACDADLRGVSGYPELFPTKDMPWQVTITVQPLFSREGLPRTCRSLVTSVPIHVQCAASSPAPLTVDFYMILGF